MSALLVTLSLLLSPRTAYAQELNAQPFQQAPPMPDLSLPPSPPDPAPPQFQPPSEIPVGVAQPNPDFQADIERRNESARSEDEARRNSSMNTSAPSHDPKVEKLRLAKMEKGPVIAPAAWKKGHWFHGKHDGSFAWWWIVDGTYFHYTKLVYPYPDHERRQV